MGSFHHDLAAALREGLERPDDLAFLSVTGKVETYVRDHVAIYLQKQFGGHFICREHKRIDLAVLRADGQVVATVEFKDCIAGDFLHRFDEVPRYASFVLEDLDKSLQKISPEKPMQNLAVLIVQAQNGNAEGRHGLKYRGGRSGHDTWRHMDIAQKAWECDGRVNEFLNVLEAGHAEGEALGIRVRTMWWIIDGPRKR